MGTQRQSHIKIISYSLRIIWMLTVLRAFLIFNRNLEKLLDIFKIKVRQ